MLDCKSPEERLGLLSEAINDTSGSMTDDLESEVRVFHRVLTGMYNILTPEQVDVMLAYVLHLIEDDDEQLMTGAEEDAKDVLIANLKAAVKTTHS